MRSGKHRRFQHSDQEAHGIELLDVCDAALGEGNNAPEDLKDREQPSCPRRSLERLAYLVSLLSRVQRKNRLTSRALTSKACPAL